jgi:hypothetical protein
MISYLLNQNEQGNRVQALAGNVVNQDTASVEREFKETRDYFGQQDGRQYYHVALSFERNDLGDMVRPDGSPDHDRISAYGDEWAKEAGIADHHEYLVVVHGEKEHPHAHVIWNATGFDGRKYHNDKHNLDRLRDVNDRVARRHGIQRELDRVRDSHRPSDKFIRRAERGGNRYSWKLDMQDRIREAARRAFSEAEFKARLKERGVELRIRGEKYSYAMTDTHGKSRTAREKRLGENYERAALLEKFARQKEQLARDPVGYRKRLKAEEEGRYTWQRDLRGRIREALQRSTDHPGFSKNLSSQGVTVHADDGGRYRFTFEDGHGLRHDAISATSLYRGHPPDFADRFRENSARGVHEGIPNVRLGRTVGREAGGLVAVLMKEVEGAGRDPHAGSESMPTREDLREAMRWQRRRDQDLQEGW